MALASPPPQTVVVFCVNRAPPGNLMYAIVELNGVLRFGRLAFTTEGVERITGRALRIFRAWAPAHVHQFEPNAATARVA